MPHVRNVQSLAELLFRAERWELGIEPPSALLPRARQEVSRRRATFLSDRGVLVPGAVPAEVRQALNLPAEADAEPRTDDRVREMLEEIVRG